MEKEYEDLRKKYNLPSYKELDEEFEIRAIDLPKSGILIKALIRTINTKLALFLNYLEPVLNTPPQSLHSLIEIKNTSNEDKKEMYIFYKRLAKLFHENCIIELKDERTIARQINKIWKEWPQIKQKQIALLEKISDAWAKEDEEETKTEYTG